MKTREDVINYVDEYYSNLSTQGKTDLCMQIWGKIYADSKLDEAAEKAKVKKIKLTHNKIVKYVYVVESQSILSLKDKV